MNSDHRPNKHLSAQICCVELLQNNMQDSAHASQDCCVCCMARAVDGRLTDCRHDVLCSKCAVILSIQRMRKHFNRTGEILAMSSLNDGSPVPVLPCPVCRALSKFKPFPVPAETEAEPANHVGLAPGSPEPVNSAGPSEARSELSLMD